MENVQQRVATTLTRIREATGELYSEIVEATGLPVNAVHSANRCNGRTLSLSDVYALARHHDIHIVDLTNGGVRYLKNGEERPPRKWPKNMPKYEALEGLVRTRMRAARLKSGKGTFALARQIDVNQTWIVREESGEIQTIDLIRVERLALALGTTFTTWLT